MTIELLLKKIPLFEGLTAPQYQELGQVSLLRSAPKGATIFSEGDEAKGLFIVVTGQVKIFKLSPDGKEQILHIFGPLEPFAEVALFAGAVYPANALALRASDLLFIGRDRFMECVGKSPAVALNLLGAMALRLKKFSHMIEALSLKEAPGRLAEHILFLSSQQENSSAVHLDIPKTQLASLLGASPETLSRMLQKMSRERLITINGSSIAILDRQGLEALAAGEMLLSERG